MALSSNTAKVEEVISEIESGTIFVNPYAAANVFLNSLMPKAKAQIDSLTAQKNAKQMGSVILYDHTDWPLHTANSYNANKYN